MEENQETASEKSARLAVEREAKYRANPSAFVDIDDIVMGVVKTPSGGLGIMTGACKRVEMEIGLTRLNYKVNQLFMAMDMQAASEAEEASKIITPGNGGAHISPKDFARGRR